MKELPAEPPGSPRGRAVRFSRPLRPVKYIMPQRWEGGEGMASTTLSVGLVIGASLASSVGSTFKSLEGRLAQTQQKAESLRLGAAAGRRWQDLRSESLKLSAAMQAGKLDAAGVARFRELKAATAEAAAEAKRYGLTLGGLSKQIGAMERMEGVQSGLAARSSARAGRRSERSSLRGELVGTMALGAAMLAPVYQAVQFESAMADVRKVVDGLETPEAFAAMSSDILELSTRLPMSATGLAAITAAAGQFGIARGELMDFAESAAKMAVAFDMSAEESGEAMAKIRASTQMSQAEVIRLGDAVNHLSNNTASSAPQLVEFTKRTAGVGKIAGLSAEQMAAMGSAFVAMGTPAEVAARATNAFVMKLATASKQSKPVVEAFADMGYSATELERRMQLDPQGTILEFLERAGRQKNVLAALGGVFGTGWSDDVAKLVSGLEEYKKALGLVADESAYAGSMEREYTARAATSANELQLLRNRMYRLSVTAGTMLLPGLNAVITPLGKMADRAAELASKYPSVVKAAAAMGFAFVGLKGASILGRMGLSWVRDGASVAMDAFQLLRPSTIRAGWTLLRMGRDGAKAGGLLGRLGGAVGRLRAGAAADFKALSAGASALFNPWTLGIVGVLGAVWLLWRNWDDFTAAWSAGWADAHSAVSEGRIGDAVMDAVSTPLRAVMVLISDAIGLWDSFMQKLGVGVGSAKAAAGAVSAAAERRTAGEYQSGDEYLFGPEALQPAENARGGFVGRRTLSWLGEDGGEYVIPVGASYRARGRLLLARAAGVLGVALAPSGGESMRRGAHFVAPSGEGTPLPSRAVTINGGIHVHAAPGMDVRALSAEVLRRLRSATERAGRGMYADDALFG